MKRIVLLLVALFVVLSFCEEADAFRRRRWRRTANYSAGASYNAGYSPGGAQARANELARKGFGHHFSLPCNGASREGWGFSTVSPQAALNSCCWFNTGIVEQATAWSPASGGWYAIRLYW